MRYSGVAKRRRIKGPNGLKEKEICDRLDTPKQWLAVEKRVDG